MVLNLSDETARHLLAVVDAAAVELLASIPTLGGVERARAAQRLQHLGIVKHRLEWNLGYPEPFPGPIAWGAQYGLKR